MVRELIQGASPDRVIIDEVADWPSRRLRRGFSEKLLDRKIYNVYRELRVDSQLRWVLIWKYDHELQQWVPQDEDRYYDDHETGENYD